MSRIISDISERGMLKTPMFHKHENIQAFFGFKCFQVILEEINSLDEKVGR
jgi:hypothetical protein